MTEVVGAPKARAPAGRFRGNIRVYLPRFFENSGRLRAVLATSAPLGWRIRDWKVPPRLQPVTARGVSQMTTAAFFIEKTLTRLDRMKQTRQKEQLG